MAFHGSASKRYVEPCIYKFHSDASTDWVSCQAMSSTYTQVTLCSYSNFIVCWVSDYISANALVSQHIYFNWNILEVIIWG